MSTQNDSTSPTSTSRGPLTKRQRLLRVYAAGMIFLLVAVLAVFAKGFIDGTFTSIDSLQEYLSRYGARGPLLLGAFQCLKVLVPVIPSSLGFAAGTILFGPRTGFLCNYIALCIGSITAFFLAKKAGKPLLDDLFPGGKFQKLSDWAANSKSYTVTLIIAMIQPLLPDDFFCYLSGLSGMNSKKFVVIILLVRPWIILAYSIGFSLI